MYLKTIECGNHSQIQSSFWANLKGNLYKLGEKQRRCKAVVGIIGFDMATWGIQAFNDFFNPLYLRSIYKMYLLLGDVKVTWIKKIQILAFIVKLTKHRV